MKKTALLALNCLVIMLLATSAWATYFDYFSGDATCIGWSASGAVLFGDEEYVDMNYLVELSDGSTIVASFSGVHRVYSHTPEFALGSPWGLELCGTYTATGEFSFTSPDGSGYESFSKTFTCNCEPPPPPPPPPGGCTGTPGYWKNHPEEWPVLSLIIGGQPYTQAQLMDIFDYASRGDKTVKLFHHTAAAMLNVLYGAGTAIQPTIDAANAFLTAHPLGSKPTGADGNMANSLKGDLVEYNESNPCGSGSPTLLNSVPSRTSQVDEEVNTWGAIKKIYNK